MNKNHKTKTTLIGLFTRYILIILLGLGNLFIFYKLLTPITTNTTFYILSLFSSSTAFLSQNTILFKQVIIELIPACIAGSAYYLLFILLFSTPNIKPLKRIKILIISFISFFILNIIRITFLANIASLTIINHPTAFESIHLIFWYLISTLFVIAIWLLIIKHYKLKSIPIYTDLKFIYKLIKKE